MRKRWVLAVLLVVVCLPVLAHKSPIIEYTYVGHIWEEAYTTIPRQPVESELVILRTHVEHPNETIEGNVTAQVGIYRDDTTYGWYGGESYKEPNWLLIKDAWMQPTGNPNEFEQDVIIAEAGSYQVFIDWYENHQYIGQSMHMLDIETRTVGPLFLIFGVLIVLLTCIGVRRGAV